MPLISAAVQQFVGAVGRPPAPNFDVSPPSSFLPPFFHSIPTPPFLLPSFLLPPAPHFSQFHPFLPHFAADEAKAASSEAERRGVKRQRDEKDEHGRAYYEFREEAYNSR